MFAYNTIRISGEDLTMPSTKKPTVKKKHATPIKIKTESSIEDEDNYEYMDSEYLQQFGGMQMTEVKADCNIGQAKPQNTCDICQRKFSTAQKVSAHRYSHTQDSRFTCLICYKTYISKQALERHFLSHHINLRYQCNICLRQFTQDGKYDAHMKTHFETMNPHECQTCKQGFSQAFNLKRHQAAKGHGDNTTEYKVALDTICSICHKVFSRKEHLNTHMKLHTGGQKPYQCGVCTKEFTSKSHYLEHGYTHVDIKLYECDICHKSFGQSTNLSKHMSVHTGKKKFKCNICVKRYSTKSQLNRHLKVHAGDKAYSCEVCGKPFVRKDDLPRHLKTHSGKKSTELKEESTN